MHSARRLTTLPRMNGSARAVWLFALAVLLLLKAAAPSFAAHAAKSQGRALVEVCTIYGVASRMMDGVPGAQPRSGFPEPGQFANSSHSADSTCALVALGVSAGPTAVPSGAECCAVAAHTRASRSAARACTPDAAARWAAARFHAPPI
jgi:hypothetical protein